MSKTTEIEVKFDGGRVLSSEVKDGICRLVVEVEEGKDENFLMLKEINSVPRKKELYDPFILVPASELSLTDDFMRHTPKTKREEELRKKLVEVIRSRVPDFYRPRLDPSFDKNGKISYQPGARPALGKSYSWWEKNAKEFCPECKSRLGTKAEYVAFLGVLIKKLVASGWEVALAWNAVCNDSSKLEHYRNFERALQDFEPTGSREICGFCDLTNTAKLLAEDKEIGGFWLGGSFRLSFSDGNPIAVLGHGIDRYHGFSNSVGWIVFEA